LALLLALTIAMGAAWPAQARDDSVSPEAYQHRVSLPGVYRGWTGCDPIPGESYGSLIPDSEPTDRPAHQHGDINLALRGFEPTVGHMGLIDVRGAADSQAPQLSHLFSPLRLPEFVGNHRVRDWDWGCNCRGGPISAPGVTLVEMRTTAGETLHLPGTDRTIGSGYDAMVLYADESRITLKWTREDNVIWGYTMHLENICVEPSLLALYQRLNDEGRAQLPVLRAGQAFGRARGVAIGVAIRDTGRFMDPRSRKDWWSGF
jgi:hypothetical protein